LGSSHFLFSKFLIPVLVPVPQLNRPGFGYMSDSLRKQGALYTMALPLTEYQQLIFMINWS
jgi:hypothetical protein